MQRKEIRGDKTLFFFKEKVTEQFLSALRHKTVTVKTVWCWWNSS